MLSRGTEKKSIGVPLRSSLSHRSIQPEKKEGEAKASCAWRQGMSGGETYKGGADGGGGRAKGKTKAGRHSRTPSETWPPERECRKESRLSNYLLTEIDDFLNMRQEVTCDNQTDRLDFVYN